MSDEKNSNPVVGTITFGPGVGDGKAVTLTEYKEGMPSIDVPSIMRAAGFEEGFAAGRRAALEEAVAMIEAERDHLLDNHLRWGPSCFDKVAAKLREEECAKQALEMLRAAAEPEGSMGDWREEKVKTCETCAHSLDAHSSDGCNAPGCLCSDGVLP